MKRNVGVVALATSICALSIVGTTAAAPDNKNSITIGMTCDHGAGSVTGATIDQNNAGTLNILEPVRGTYVIKRAVIDGQLVYENRGFADRIDDLVRCVPVSLNGGPLPPDNPDVVWWGILNT